VNGPGEVTALLRALGDGDRKAFDLILPLVYDELHAIAHRQLAGRRPGQTLQTTALVHEAYLKLVDQERADWQDRTHFLAVAATAMRHIVVSRARHHAARKRGGAATHVALEDDAVGLDTHANEILALDQALEWLAGFDRRLASLVELRFFGGLSVEETAEVQGTSPRTGDGPFRARSAFTG
jgi:RNA polymerase sigma factor (TIGR02999 family)